MTTKSVAGLIVSAALILSPAVASAQVATPQSAGKADTAQDASGKAATSAVEEKKVCKQLPSSSSRLPQRACLTRKQWKLVEDEVSR
jgi:hypothetical protein